MKTLQLLFVLLMVVCPLAISPAAWATAAGPPTSLNAPVLPNVEEFAMSRSQMGHLSLVYCNQGCRTIFYRTLSETGAWSASEVVKDNWNRRMGNFAIDVDQVGIPHVFWGEGVDTSGTIHHATRQANGAWPDV